MSVSFRGSEAAEEFLVFGLLVSHLRSFAIAQDDKCDVFLDSSPSVQNDGEINE